MTSLPTEMTAIEISSFGGPEVLRPAKRPLPQLGADEVLIKVAAAGINRPDVLQRTGGYAPPPRRLRSAGPRSRRRDRRGRQRRVKDWHVGDKVTALVSGGGYAEYCAAPAPQCLPMPKGFDMIHAAALPETFFTVWTNVFERGAPEGRRDLPRSMAGRAASAPRPSSWRITSAPR